MATACTPVLVISKIPQPAATVQFTYFFSATYEATNCVLPPKQNKCVHTDSTYLESQLYKVESHLLPLHLAHTHLPHTHQVEHLGHLIADTQRATWREEEEREREGGRKRRGVDGEFKH